MRIIFITAAFIMAACSQVKPAVTPEPHPVVLAHVEAFNVQDAKAMAEVEHPDIEWLTATGSEILVEVSGRENLTKSMEEFFKSPTKITGTLRDWSINGNYIAVTETAHWSTSSGEAKSQSALTVYQLEDNLIRRVWYYPSVEN